MTQQQWSELTNVAVVFAIAVLTLATAVVTNYTRKHFATADIIKAQAIIAQVVMAVEQQFKSASGSALVGSVKKDAAFGYARDMLDAAKIDVSDQHVKMMIEAAVGEMNHEKLLYGGYAASVVAPSTFSSLLPATPLTTFGSVNIDPGVGSLTSYQSLRSAQGSVEPAETHPDNPPRHVKATRTAKPDPKPAQPPPA